MALRTTVDFIGIGAARSGTSWLTNCLRLHPDICMSEPKEIRYFNRYAPQRAAHPLSGAPERLVSLPRRATAGTPASLDSARDGLAGGRVWIGMSPLGRGVGRATSPASRDASQRCSEGDLPVGLHRQVPNPNHEQTLAWYMNHFRHGHAHQIAGEFTPLYLYDEAAPVRIRDCFPNAKLIACLRNPIDRAYSHYWYLQGADAHAGPSFEEALEREPHYIGRGLYARQLRRYLEHFAREQILILLFDDMIHQPEAELERTFRFLGVRRDIPPGALQSDKNSTTLKRSSRLRRGLRAASGVLVDLGFSPLVNQLRRLGVHRLVRQANEGPFRYPPMDAGTRRYLNVVFRDDIEELARLLGRDLSHWT